MSCLLLKTFINILTAASKFFILKLVKCCFRLSKLEINVTLVSIVIKFKKKKYL